MFVSVSLSDSDRAQDFLYAHMKDAVKTSGPERGEFFFRFNAWATEAVEDFCDALKLHHIYFETNR